ncbi:AAA family ATPase [Microlunatus speluncae]|uniref:AAA family ATPase n=1 Tax=Microlunatus speluncae TaxID=2594267 RepID=UPI001266604A|nr:AAA family ATPase [Microlunatus speluncae]
MRKVVLITGPQAVGKSTIGRLLARRLRAPSVSFDGDVLYRMVEVGNVDWTPESRPEAERQVRLRYRAGAELARLYTDHGFDFVLNDNVFGDDVTVWMERVAESEPVQRHLVVLNAEAETIAERELARSGGRTYRAWQQPGMDLVDAVRAFQAESVDVTPRRGLWLDTTDLSAEATVDAIVTDDLAAARY